jgi:ketol-acid reductoisomerase
MPQIYYDADADLKVLEGKTVSVIGYGSQGRGQSLCLRDSGVNVIIGARPGKSWDAARKTVWKSWKPKKPLVVAT